MGSFLAKNGEWMVMTDLVWAKLSDNALVKRAGQRRRCWRRFCLATYVELELRQLIASGIAGYRLPFVSLGSRALCDRRSAL